jgi:hypothetical protein
MTIGTLLLCSVRKPILGILENLLKDLAVDLNQVSTTKLSSCVITEK